MKGISSATVVVIIATISVSLVGSYFLSKQIMERPTEVGQLGIGILQISTITGMNCNEIQANCIDAGKSCRGPGQCADSGVCATPGCPDLPNAHMTSNDCSATYNTGCKYCARPSCALDPAADSCIESGSCNYECDDGWFDDDGDPNNGCETPLSLFFNITLPGVDPIESSGIAPGIATIPLEFNATSKTDYDVVPCVYGYSCNPGYIQDDTTPIFNFTNTGNAAEKWNISLSQALPSYIHLYGDTDNLRSGATEITMNGWIVADNIPVGGYVEMWLWADFIDALPGQVDIAINHTSMSTT